VPPSPFRSCFLQLNHEHLPGRFVAAHEPSGLPELEQLFVCHSAEALAELFEIDWLLSAISHSSMMLRSVSRCLRHRLMGSAWPLEKFVSALDLRVSAILGPFFDG
jgi:hypothetical protein